MAWRFETRDGKATKVPVNPKTGGNSMANNSSTWGTYTQAFQRASSAALAGVGLQINGAGMIGVDIDYKPHDTMPEAVRAFLEAMPATYTELSPSGRGVRAFAFGTLPKGCRHKVVIADGVELEVYDSGRFLTVTGNAINPAPLADLTTFMASLEVIKPLEKPRANITPRASMRATRSS
ncbi:MAG: hypothetical protein HC933_00515 [Pleurocapsa sp. SU_196_0]|nr:hypothetical protein [Pleurocapsa sp. SU_196_0]